MFFWNKWKVLHLFEYRSYRKGHPYASDQRKITEQSDFFKKLYENSRKVSNLIIEKT